MTTSTEVVHPETLSEFQDILQAQRMVREKKEAAETAVQKWKVAMEFEARRAVLRYNLARLNLFRERMAERGENWCTYGRHLVSGELQAVLIFVSSRRGEQVITYTEDAHGLHQLCDKCLTDAYRRGNDSPQRKGESLRIRRLVSAADLPQGTPAHELKDNDITLELERRYGLPPLARWGHESSAYRDVPEWTLIIGDGRLTF